MPESEEENRATSWSGSEQQRRDQGTCLPPKKRPLFVVPVGTPLRVLCPGRITWRDWAATRELVFEKLQSDQGRFYTFLSEGYRVAVNKQNVLRREQPES